MPTWRIYHRDGEPTYIEAECCTADRWVGRWWRGACILNQFTVP